MQNQEQIINNNSPQKANPFKEYFETPQYENPIMAASFNFKDNKFREKILGESESEEIALEAKLNKELVGKFTLKRRSTRFPSSKELNQKELTETLKQKGILKGSDEDHLIIRKMPQITDEQYYQTQNSIVKQDNNELKNLYNHLKTVNCNYKSISSNSGISGLIPLTYLIESFYEVNKDKAKEMNDKYNLLKPYIYNYRDIKGDGNCYYRAVIFRYLEILILNKKIDILKKVVYDVVESFKSEELKNRRIILNNDIKPDLTFKILFLIVDLLKNDMITEAHQILVKSFSTCQKFDYAIILYFRYILYEYIKKNENKIYLKTFPIKIGNLLPSQYENDSGEFLFQEFYENYLLKFFHDAEKIIIYLTPFVLGIELNIAIFDVNDDILQKFIWEGESEIKTDEVISLLNNRNHYEIIYNKKDNERNKKYYEIFENKIKSVVLFEIDKYLTPKAEDDFNCLNTHKREDINEIVDERKPMTVVQKVIRKDSNNIRDNNIQNNNILDNNIQNNNNNIQNNIIQNNNTPNNNIIPTNYIQNNNTSNNNIQNNIITPENSIQNNNFIYINKDNNTSYNYDYRNPNNVNNYNNNIDNNNNNNSKTNKNDMNNCNIQNNNIPKINNYINNNNNINNANNNLNNINNNDNLNQNNYNINQINNKNMNNNKNILNRDNNNNKFKNDNMHNNTKKQFNQSILNYDSNNDYNKKRNNDVNNVFINMKTKTTVNKRKTHKNNNEINNNEIYNNQQRQKPQNNNCNLAQGHINNNNTNINNQNNTNNLNNNNLNNNKNTNDLNTKIIYNEVCQDKVLGPFNPPNSIGQRINHQQKKNIGEFRTPEGDLIHNNNNNKNNINNNNINNNNNNNNNTNININNFNSNNYDSSSDTSSIRTKTTQYTQNNNLIKCYRCNINIILNNKELPFCESCFKYRIYKAYLNSFQNKKDHIDSSNIYIDFNSKKYFLVNLIEIYNINFENKLNQNDIITRIHNKECIFKEFHLNEYSRLPCGCELCEYLLAYLSSFPYNTRFICKCLKEYNRLDMIKLGILLSLLKKNNAVKNIIDYFNKRLFLICCICSYDFKEGDLRFELKNILCKDYLKYDVKEGHINHFLKYLKHYICQKCSNVTKDKFHCYICDITHQIINN